MDDEESLMYRITRMLNSMNSLEDMLKPVNSHYFTFKDGIEYPIDENLLNCLGDERSYSFLVGRNRANISSALR